MKCLGMLLVALVAMGFLETAPALDRHAGTGSPTPATSQPVKEVLAAAAQPISYSLADAAGVTTTRDQRPAVVVAGSTRVEGSMTDAAGGRQGIPGTESPVAAGPEPAGWVALLCALVVVAFMAWRKSRWIAG